MDSVALLGFAVLQLSLEMDFLDRR
jgi:hypothetical protein